MSNKMADFWIVALCSLVEVHGRFRRTTASIIRAFLLTLRYSYHHMSGAKAFLSSFNIIVVLKVESARTCETCVNFTGLHLIRA
jgi:hypothetical protein